MGQQNEQLRKILKRKRSKSLPALKKELSCFTYDETLYEVLEFLEVAVENLNMRSNPAEHSYLKKCFDYFNYTKGNVTFEDDDLLNEIYSRLVVVSSKLQYKITNPGPVSNYIVLEQNKIILKQLIREVHAFRDKTINKLTLSEEEYVHDIIPIVNYVVFEIRDLKLTENLIMKLPSLRNIKYGKNKDKSFFVCVFENYIKALKESRKSDAIYFENVFKVLLSSEIKKSHLEDLRKCSSSLKKYLKSKKNKEFNTDLDAYNNLKAIERIVYGEVSDVQLKKVEMPKIRHVSLSSDKLDDLKPSTKNFLDLRNEYTFTIDSKECKIKEDAISIKKNDIGGYDLNVYITDIAEYLKEKEDLVEEIFSYITNGKLYGGRPFPSAFLSENISFDEGKDRRAIAFMFSFNNKMELKNLDIKNSMINVNNNFFQTITDEKLEKVNEEGIRSIEYLTNFIAVHELNQNLPDHKITFCKTTLTNELKKYPEPCLQLISHTANIVNNLVAEVFYINDLPLIYADKERFSNQKYLRSVTDLDITDFQKNALREALSGKGVKNRCRPYYDPENSFYGKPVTDLTNPLRSEASFVNHMIIKNLILSGKYSFDDNVMSDEAYEVKVEYEKMLPYFCECINQKKDFTQKTPYVYKIR